MRGSVFVGTSLDGFVARPDGSLDFLEQGGDETHGFDEFLATVDALVMGRRTFETLLGFGVWAYGELPVFVLSTAAINDAPMGATVERLSGNPREIAQDLAARGIEHLYVDGAATIQQFLSAGLIQRLIITRLPVLIGRGIALFADLEQDIVLKHLTTRQFPSGLVQSEYEVVS